MTKKTQILSVIAALAAVVIGLVAINVVSHSDGGLTWRKTDDTPEVGGVAKRTPAGLLVSTVDAVDATMADGVQSTAGSRAKDNAKRGGKMPQLIRHDTGFAQNEKRSKDVLKSDRGDDPASGANSSVGRAGVSYGRKGALDQFFDSIHLDAEGRELYEAVMHDPAYSIRDIVRRGEPVSLEQGDLIKKRFEHQDDQIKAILGPEGFVAYKEFFRSLMFRPFAEDTAARCATSGVPMPPATVEALTLAMVRVESPFQIGIEGMILTEAQYRGMTYRDHYMIDSVRTVLTPAQLACFEQTLAARFKRQ